MKKALYLMIGLFLICSAAAGCRQRDSGAKIESGTYEIDAVKYISLFSSSSPDYYLQCNAGTLFTVGGGSFQADVSRASSPSVKPVSYQTVTYTSEPLGKTIETTGSEAGAVDISGFKEKSSYKVMANGQDTGFRIYYLDKNVWIGHFSWFGAKKDAWWADYIFSVKTHEAAT